MIAQKAFCQKAFCWCFLMTLNIPLLIVAVTLSFLVQLYEMPFSVWNNVTEQFSDDS